MERIKAILQNPQGIRWLFYGDSITHGAKHTEGFRDFSELFRERVLWEMLRQKDLVLNAAYSGFTSTNLLEDFEWRAKAFMPTVAFVMIGTNDVARGIGLEQFEGQIEELTRKFQEIGTLPVLITPLPVLRNLDEARKDVSLYAEVIRKVAKKHQLPLIDEFESWRNDPAEFYLYSDPVHPNAAGHRKIALDIFKALGIFETDSSWVCRFFVPPAE
ncbi:MAG: SGNH/GDSL hydrolase family protein [Lentisphaeria bacterium]|nr:SGNH/GDSL hydrolase family protein [Lentisphaeria bacterium]